MLHALPQHHLMEDLSSVEPDEPDLHKHVRMWNQRITHESSISGILRFCNGETSFLRASWLNAGLGTGRIDLVGESEEQ